MKSSTLLTRSLLAGFALFAGIQTTQAQAISYSSIANNVDMLVANIFGVQCEGVTNVQINGAPYAVGRFDNGQGVGLNSGMMLSTGYLNYSYMPVSNLPARNSDRRAIWTSSITETSTDR